MALVGLAWIGPAVRREPLAAPVATWSATITAAFLARLERGSCYGFFPIPNHLRIFAIRLAIGRVYALSSIVFAKPSAVSGQPALGLLPDLEADYASLSWQRRSAIRVSSKAGEGRRTSVACSPPPTATRWWQVTGRTSVGSTTSATCATPTTPTRSSFAAALSSRAGVVPFPSVRSRR